MEISATVQKFNLNASYTNKSENEAKKIDTTKKLSKEDVDELKTQITQNSNKMMLESISVQSSITSLFGTKDDSEKEYEGFQSFLKDIGYEGKPIAELSKEEAAELVSEDGFFGVDKTAQRIADFVIVGSGGDEKMMREGREGMLQGFKDAEEMWGSELPDISKETMKKATELIDKAMQDLGYSVLDEQG